MYQKIKSTIYFLLYWYFLCDSEWWIWLWVWGLRNLGNDTYISALVCNSGWCALIRCLSCSILWFFWIIIMQKFAVASLILGPLGSKCLQVFGWSEECFFPHYVIILPAFKHVCPFFFICYLSFSDPSWGWGCLRWLRF